MRPRCASCASRYAGVCARQWPTATAAPDGDLAALWRSAAAQGWLELGAGLLPAAIAVQEELGRVGCPLPVVDAALIGAVLTARGDDATAAAVGAARVRPVLAAGVAAGPAAAATLRHVEAAGPATHLLVIDDEAGQLGWYDLTDAEVIPRPGLAVPSWSTVRTVTGPQWTAPLADYPDLILECRLGLAARSLAAAGRTHELAVEHAKQRRQFGQPIGVFQAVSHRLVDGEMVLVAGRQLLEHALRLRTEKADGWRLAAEIYLEFAAARAAGLQFAAHHTLAAIGYFTEHEAPWLFRRMHADLAAASVHQPPGGVGSAGLDRGERLPDFRLGPAEEAIRAEVLEAFAPWSSGPPAHLGGWDDAARAVFRDRGWIGVGWPREFGGGGYAATEVMAFSEALAYANPPLGNIMMGINSIAPMLIGVGPPALRDFALGEIRRGDLSVALGYSEPEAGSDLAALRTRAERGPGGWRVNGQKMWGTCVPDSRLILLAARTDPDAVPPHAGISLFLVDLDSPGITVSEHRSLGGDVSATTFWDDVLVPEDRLVGQVNQGWQALTAALAGERVLIGASVMRVHRSFDRLVDLIRAEPQAVLPGRREQLRSEIGRLAVRLQAARAMVSAGVRAMASGAGARTEAPMAKIMATELAEDLNATAVALLGPSALYHWGADGAAGDGYFEDGLRTSIMGVIAGGTGDIQRNLVARGMGLPR